MPTCSEAYGEGWGGDYPNCTYNPSQFSGSVGSLGYGADLAGTTLADDWRKYFDPYDPEEEEMFTKAADIDIGQLETAWDLTGKQLGETWGLKREELGAGAGKGYGEVREAGSKGYKQSNLAFSGTVAEMERKKRGEVTGAYKRSFGLGKSAYEQAMEAGQLGLQQATTDIYQDLQTDIFGARKDWREDQRSTLNVLLGGDIYNSSDTTTTGNAWDNTPPGIDPPANEPAPGQGFQDTTDPNRTWYYSETKGWFTVNDEGETEGVYKTLCFTGDTRIITIDGSKTIESINKDDIVKTFDLKNNELKESVVTKTFKHKNPNGYIVINNILKTTPNHPFYSNGKWKEAGKLVIGDKILHMDGVEHKVKSIDIVDKKLDVYNIEVDGTHNYFAEGYLVHNK